MMKFTVAAGAALLAGVSFISADAQAFGRGCGGHAVACYEKVRTPDVYVHVDRKVVVRPAYREVVESPALYGSRPMRVEVRPASTYTVREPAIYATRMKRVLVRPARVTYDHVPAVVQRVRENVVVKAGGYRWEHRRGLFGRDRMCKVRTPDVTRSVVRDVVVAPARRVARVSPAVYEHVPQKVLLREAGVRRIHQPALTAVVDRTVMLRAPERHVVHHPAVFGTERSRVLVSRGGYAWQASHGGHGLFGHR